MLTVYRSILLFCLLLFSQSTQIAEAANEITNIRWSVQADAADGSKVVRIVVDIKEPAKTDFKYNEKAKTLTVDIKNTLPGKNTGSLPIKSESIKRMLSRKLSSGNSQLVLYLSRDIGNDSFKVFALKKDPENKKPDRIVIDIYESKPKTYEITPSLSGKVIVIDPGHGGSDPGAIGQSGTREKDMTLAISLKLRDALAKKGVKVVMTRTKDVDVHSKGATDKDELQARVDVGVKAKADIFLSVHHNASSNRAIGGLSTYYYAKTKYDSILANALQKSMIAGFGLENKGVRHAEFYVTKRIPMPAALLEIAFISNPKEEKLLKSAWFQNKAVACIVQGLENYFKEAAGGAKK